MKNLVYLLLFICIFNPVFSHGAEGGKSTSIYIDAVDSYIGGKMGIGQCPCIRYAIRTKLVSGHVETKYFLIRTDSLFLMEIDRGLNFSTTDSLTKKIFTMGASEIMWKDHVLGLHFPGVTIGNDMDRGYSDIIRTGIHLLVKAYQSQHVNATFRIGYDHEQGKVNLFKDFNSNMMHSSFAISANKGRQRFNFGLAYQMIPHSSWEETSNYQRATADISYSVDLVKTDYFDMYLGASIHGEADMIRKNRDYLAPYNITFQLYIGGRFHTLSDLKKKKH